MDDPCSVCTNIDYGTDFNNVPQPDHYDSDFYYRVGSPNFPGSSFDQDDGGEHHNCGVGNKLCYLLTDGGRHYGYDVNGLGIEAAADLYYEALFVLPKGADYYDLYFALTEAALVLDMNTPDRVSIETACQAVGISTEVTAHWWTFDDPNDPNNDPNWALDLLGGKHGMLGSTAGTDANDPNWFEDPNRGWCLDFRGGEYVDVNSSIAVLEGSTVTVSAWICPNDLSGPYRPIVSQYYKSGDYHGYDLCLDDSNLPTFYLDEEKARLLGGSKKGGGIILRGSMMAIS